MQSEELLDPPTTQDSTQQRAGREDRSVAPRPPQDPSQFKEKRRKGRSIWGTLGTLVGMVLCAVLGVVAGIYSFEDIERMRQLERTPQVQVASVITGEVNIRGTAQPYVDTLRGPDSGRVTLYYYYTIEEERRDSEGNTYWATIHTSRSAVDFYLEDSTGQIVLQATQQGVEFDAPRKHRVRRGDRRYTEHRIDPGDEIFTFGFAEEVLDEYRVGYLSEGDYYPLISAGDELGQRHSRAIASGLMIVLGVGLLLFAVFFLMHLLRIHQTAFFLSTATAVVVMTLLFQGYSMMVNDLTSADEGARRILVEGERVIGEMLEERGIAMPAEFEELGSFQDPRYSRLSEEERLRVSGIRMMMSRSVTRTNNNLSQFPEVIVGPLNGVRRIDPVPVPPDEAEEIDRLEADHRPVRLGFLYGLGAILVGIAGTMLGTRLGLHKIVLKRTIENVPTSPTTGVAYGLAEIKGRVKKAPVSQIWSGPLSGKQCVYYRYLVREKRGSGKNSRWVTITDQTKRTKFYCQDQSGKILIDSTGARCVAASTVSRSSGNRRYTEWSIALDEQLYALGEATIHPDKHDELILTKGDGDTPFLISSYSEDELMEREAAAGFVHLNFGIVATMMAGMGIAGMVIAFGPLLYVTTAAVSCAYLFVVLVFLYYNDLVFLQDRVDRGWANIDVALKKRFDLIGNLAEVAQEMMGHERQLQERVALARQAHHQADSDAPNEQVLQAGSQARDHLFALMEANPEIRSQEAVSKLMTTLGEVEDEIALMRQGYNDAVERYNTRRNHFPELFVARAARFGAAMHLMETTGAEERQAPSVTM